MLVFTFMEKEIWKKIPNYEYFLVSNLGNVKSLKFKKEKQLTQRKNKNGYMILDLCENSVKKTFKTHQLVAICFLNHNPCGMKLVVNHINFNRTDNRLSNLEIVTNRENCNRKHLKSSSVYVGVTFRKQTKKWISQIKINNKNMYLGTFINEYDAHLAYQNKYQELLTKKQ